MPSLRGRTTIVASALGALLLPFGGAAQAASQGYTDLPELQVVRVVSMRTPSRSSATHPAGLTLAYRFDEPVTTPDSAGFLVYSRAGVASHATDAQAADDTVTVFFPGVDSKMEATSLSLAVVEEGAVSDTNGRGNPVGATGLVRVHRTVGSKSCIRLLRVGDLRHVGRRTIVNFVFTSFASCNDGATGADRRVWAGAFHLEMTDGRSIPARAVRYRRTDPLSIHRLTVRAVFPGTRVRRHIGRATARAGAVAYDWWGASDDAGDEGNWLEARAISHGGHTARPDLVSVSLQPSEDPQQPGHAIFAFDQPVSHPRAKRFLLDELVGGRARPVPNHPRRVRVSFLDPYDSTAVANATDGSVQDGAVLDGRADEVPVPNTLTHSTTTDPTTAGPNMLRGIYLNDSGPVAAAFGFDTQLSGSPDPAAFHLYGADGTKYDAERCSLMSVGAPDDPIYVRCAFPSAARAPKESHQLATVTAGAVHDTNGRVNPEGTAATYVPSVIVWPSHTS